MKMEGVPTGIDTKVEIPGTSIGAMTTQILDTEMKAVQ